MSVLIRIRNGMAPSGGSGGVSEGDLRGSFSDIISSLSGVVDVAGGQLLTHQAASPAMTVVVDPGIAYIPNTAFDFTDSDSIKFWEAVVAGTTASRTLVIGANSSGQTRIDLVCIKIDTGTVPDSTASNVASLIIVAGTPGAGIPATPSYYVKLAEVTVDNGATSIVNAKITDKRVQVVIKDVFLPADVDVNVVNADGWTTDSNTLVYVSPSSFKVVGSDKTAQYTKGTRIKFTNNSTTFYGVVISSVFSSDTTVTLAPNNDYAIANSAITAPFYSYQANPQGYPGWFNYTPTFGGFSSAPPVSHAQFFVTGNTCLMVLVPSSDGTSNANTFTVTLPVVPLYLVPQSVNGVFKDNSGYVTSPVTATISSGSTIQFAKDQSQNNNSWTASGNKHAQFSLNYQF